MTLGLEPQYGAFIGGKFQTVAGPTFQAKNPATGEHLADIARCGREQIDQAVLAARSAFKEWSRTSYEVRSALLMKLADSVEADVNRLAEIDACDIGRTITETRHDYQIALGQYRYFAAAIITFEDFGKPIPGGYLHARRQPIGVCGQIIPWNVPAIMAAMKLAPALAAGNTVVLKPDENASLSTMELCKHIAKVFPPGVVNVVPGLGDEAGAALTAHPGVAKLAFTGSPEVGRIVGAAGAQRLVPVSLELGGKSPNIVFPDVDNIDAVIDNVAFAGMFCNGQSCLAGTRIFVHEDIYRNFVDKLANGLSQLKVGSPLDESSRVSCLVSPKQGERVLSYIDVGKEERANLLIGGERVEVKGNGEGYFIKPTIFEANNKMRIAQEEIFGPVLSIIKWSHIDTLVEEANEVDYGLASGIYTSNISNAMYVAERLETGSVWINQYCNLHDGAPFGGFKQSGIGRESCRETLNLYTHMKSVTIADKLPDPWFLPRPQ
jgi:aldehyde dehydrogenase (NAD+)